MAKKKQIRTGKARACPQEKSFYVSDGSVYASLKELATGLRKMHPDTYSYHANAERNDFHNWIRDVFGDQKLAQRMLTARSQAHLARIIEAQLRAKR